jgi:Na+-driven multidrug efflux pump
MIKNKDTWYSNIAWFCLLGDGLTGLMLLLAPIFTLKMMGVSELPLESVYPRYLGVFVFCAGCFYAIPRFFKGVTERRTAWQTVFAATALLRICIAAFVTWAIGQGYLDKGWISVPVYDATLAILQILVLRSRVKP